MVTVVDCVHFFDNLDSVESLSDRGESLGDDDKRSIVHLLMNQIEFANIISEVKPDHLKKIKGVIKALNTDAICLSNYSDVPLKKVINTGLFDFDKASQSPGWLKELRGEHIPETEEYGISCLTYNRRRPFS